ncbi:unnamed protein product [Clonostachys solani]|uniref:Uncharacterized protein n=1 Tax=Clonostachys solani TaxID=160281 RepID=A0A9N9YZI3_9HYPO|nr:unnamed protein product [Clonostachys solani]
MSFSPKHQLLVSAVFFSILSGVVGAPIAPMTVLLAFPALGVVANIAHQLIEAREPFIRFARAMKRAVLKTRSDTQRLGTAGRPESVRFLEPDPAANSRSSTIHTAPSRASLSSES